MNWPACGMFWKVFSFLFTFFFLSFFSRYFPFLSQENIFPSHIHVAGELFFVSTSRVVAFIYKYSFITPVCLYVHLREIQQSEDFVMVFTLIASIYSLVLSVLRYLGGKAEGKREPCSSDSNLDNWLLLSWIKQFGKI